MRETAEATLTQLLRDGGIGDPDRGPRILELVYRDLRILAKSQLQSGRIGDSLPATALVHEAWIRIVGKDVGDLANRRAFFGLIARVMHGIVVDAARAKVAQKRDAARRVFNPEALVSIATSPPEDLLALDAALDKLDAKKRAIVDLRFFAGLSMPETADLLDMPLRTLEREWTLIRARLMSELNSA